MEIDEYDSTLAWAIEEEKKRINRGNGYSTIYLIIISIIIFLSIFFILYISNKVNKPGALDLITDPENLFDELSPQNIPLIEISEDGTNGKSEEPPINNLVQNQ